MSFIDLATLALHRRNEMEARIKVFTTKCDQAIHDIVKLKSQAEGFVLQLNCEPSELKDRFLNCMKNLDEYMYLITDFNLAIGKLDETSGSVEYTPVHDTATRAAVTLSPFNIIDMLSEPAPSTSTACPNQCPLKHPSKSKKVPKAEQTLIAFSSTSCSSESVPIDKNEVNRKEVEVQCELTEDLKKISLTADPTSPLLSEQCKLPAQTVLQTEHEYPAVIMNVDGPSLWVITDDHDAACKLMMDMTNYYKKNHADMSVEDASSLTYCAYYDDESDCYYRGLSLTEGDESEVAEVFLVDTGEVRGARAGCVRPLAARFATQPPFARCCHLAGIDLLSYHNKEIADKQEQYMRQYIGTHCYIEVDDNSSESLGVYVLLPTSEYLNDLLIREGLAWSTETEKPSATGSASHGPPELSLTDSQLDVSECPEYEDPVEAVTGYSCRDEMDICKHYKGGPEKTCFKGARCKKRHVLMHPDGWTLDRVSVAANCAAAMLPAPGTWMRAHVTCVCHFDRLYVQFVQEKNAEEMAPLPQFGVVLPPTTLEALVRDMNSPATRIAYKKLKMMPAPGELVAALYPLDDQWYRARVLSTTRADQNVEVMYIDYGNVVWVKEDKVRVLEARFMALRAQATRVVLAGVAARTHDSKHWAAAKNQLACMTQDRTLDTHIIARDYDEVTVEMFDEQGYSIAEQLAALNFVTLKEYTVAEDDAGTKVVVP